ncbi:MAG TPA: hypothetical protein VM221_07440 [Armatimonadota bacterium]|nr:hypothetical protein [Armatimonadota bacterium]
MPIFLNGSSVGRLVTEPGVHANIMNVGRRFFVIAANAPADRPREMAMRAPLRISDEAEDILSGAKLTTEGGILRDILQPLEVKVFKLEPAG